MLNVLVFSIELGRGNYSLYNVIRVAFSPIYIAVLITIALFSSPNVLLVALGFVAAAYAGAAFSVIYARSKDLMDESDPSGPTLYSISRGAIPFAGSTIVLVLGSQLSQILLVSLTDLHSVGMYAAALVVASAHSSFGNAVAKVAFATMATGEKSDSSAWFSEKVRYTTAIYVFVAAALVAVGPFLIPILFGTAFNEASMLLLGLIPATTLVAIGQVIDHGLQGLGIVSGGVRARIASSVLLAVLALALTPQFGVYGIMYGVLGASALELAVLCLVASSRMGIPIGDLLLIKPDELHRIRSKLGLMFGRK
jgi:O-antigen/teichoic acid export membrane protein